MGLFSRKNRGPKLPDGVTESWSDSDKAVVVSIPFDARGLPSEVADRLSDDVIATVGAVQNGEFGYCIPEGVSGAKVRVEVNTGATALGEVPTHTIEILRERLGQAMELTVATDAAAVAKAKADAEEAAAKAASPAGMPELPRYDENGKKLSLWQSMKLAAEQQTAATASAAPEIDPRADLEPAEWIWVEESNALRADIVLLGEEHADSQTSVDISYLIESTLTNIGTPEVRGLIPEGNTDYEIWLTIAVNDDAVGPITRQKLHDGEDQFENTRVDFVVMYESREMIEDMLAGSQEN
jgi:hypothetical protein